jgi:hypothetical protein
VLGIAGPFGIALRLLGSAMAQGVDKSSALHGSVTKLFSDLKDLFVALEPAATAVVGMFAELAHTLGGALARSLQALMPIIGGIVEKGAAIIELGANFAAATVRAIDEQVLGNKRRDTFYDGMAVPGADKMRFESGDLRSYFPGLWSLVAFNRNVQQMDAALKDQSPEVRKQMMRDSGNKEILRGTKEYQEKLDEVISKASADLSGLTPMNMLDAMRKVPFLRNFPMNEEAIPNVDDVVMASEAMMRALSDTRKRYDENGAKVQAGAGGGASVVVHHVQITISEQHDPNRMARVVGAHLADLSRFRRSSPYTTNFSASR